MATRYLHVMTGKHKGKRIRLADGESIIGRDEGSQIRLATSEISRQHCLLIPNAEGVLVRDLGSRNGTFINGSPIAEETLLKPGETLTVGPMTFELEGGDPSSKESSSTKARKSQSDPRASDHDIANWLDSGELPTSDTTILTGRGTAAKPLPAPKPPKKEFKSIAEEAQDIIRRFVESQKDAE